MDDGVAAMLQTLNDAFPAVETMAAAEARAVVAARRQTVFNVDDAAAEDRVVHTTVGAIPVRIYRPSGADDALRPGVVFYHGGGFVLCDIDSHDGFCRAMSRHTGSVVVSVGYRLAPEHPGPGRRVGRVRCVRLGRRPTRPNSGSTRSGSPSRGTAPVATSPR